MTPAERRNTKLLNGSRRLRIAKGSGMTVTDVNSLVNRFEQAAKMMKSVAKGKVPNIPGMGPVPGAHGGSKKSKKKGGGGQPRSGNPAKRALEAQQAPTATNSGGSGFGLGGPTPKPEDLEAFQKLLGN